MRSGKVADPFLLESLRQENDKLRAEILSLSTEAPRGAEAYASGDEPFAVSVTHRPAGTPSWPPSPDRYATVQMTWDQILYELGATLMEEGTEQQMKDRISSEIIFYQDESNLPTDSTNVRIDDDSFDTIKVQLRVLGLIQRSSKRHTPSDTNRYWSLTPYGELRLLSLRAIPRGKKMAAIREG